MIPPKVYPQPEFHMFYLEISIGYFTYDLLIYFLDLEHVTWIQIFHHLIAISSYVSGSINYIGFLLYFKQKEHLDKFVFKQTYFNSIKKKEISTPSLHLNTILKLLNLHQSLLYKINQVFFLFLFTINRIVWNLFIWWSVTKASVNGKKK
jgi:hypothetical protein